MFNFFEYRGIVSLAAGVTIKSAEPWRTTITPEIADIPGRAAALLGYTYGNAPAVYACTVRPLEGEQLADAVERVRRWLLPGVEYAALRDSYNPGFYRLAYLSKPAEPVRVGNYEAEFTAEFSAAPYKYFDDGDRAIEAHSGLTLYNPGTAAAAPIITVQGTGMATLYINDTAVNVLDIGGTITLDCEAAAAYDADALRNADIARLSKWPTLAPGENLVQYSGAGVTGVSIVPKWRSV
jgi:phage-related protein